MTGDPSKPNTAPTPSDAPSTQDTEAFFELSQDLLCIAGADGFFKRVNARWTEILGWEKDELLARPFVDFVHPEDRDATARETRQLAQGVPTVRFVNRYAHKEGGHRTLSWSSSTTGGLFYAVARDITEQHAIEQRLLESESRSRALVAAAFEGILIHSGGLVIDANPAAAEILGGSDAESLVGRNILDFMPPETREGILAHIQSRSEDAFSTTAMRLDGERVAVETRSKNFALGEREVRVTALLDITKRRAAQAQLEAQRELLALLRDIAFSVNQAPTANAALERVLHHVCKSTEWPVGHAYMLERGAGRRLTTTGVWHVDNPSTFQPFMDATAETPIVVGEGLAGRAAHTRAPLWMPDIDTDPGFLRRDGARASGIRSGVAFPVLVQDDVVAVLEFFSPTVGRPAATLLDVLGQVGALVGRAIEREQAALALTSKNLALHRSNEDLSQFAYIASHDLQEPLRIITSYLQLLEKKYADKLDDQGRGFIEYAAGGAERLKRLINDLLAFSRVETERKPMTDANLDASLDRALQNLSLRIEDAGAEVVRKSLPTLQADEGQMTQVFQNLVGNAIKFARKDGAPRIEVSCAKEDGVWHFQVKDNGIGMDSSHASRVFVIFQRLHGADEYEGTGIGLAICKRIIDRHNGRIWVESDGPGRGCTIHFTLPPRQPGATP